MNESTEVYAWGDDEDGQLGLGENRTKRFYTLPMICSFNIVLTQVSCGKDHSAILATNGHIYTMGSNQYGKLGTKTSDSAAPQLVESLSRYKCIQISCGDNHTGCVMQGGAAYTWGDNTYGQLGVKRAQEPVQVIENTQQISCGNLHTLILTKTGEVFAFGNGEYGQLGNKISKSFDPLSIRSPLIKQVVACNNFSLLLSSEGTAYACGQNYGINICRQYTKYKFIKLDGYVGAAGLTANKELIVFDSDIIMKDIDDFAIGNEFGIAVGQECYSWGTNIKGQLGSGNQQQIQQPQIIEQLNGKQIFNLSAGDSYVLALGNANKYYQNHQSSFSQSNIRSVSRKGEERSRSNFSDRSHVDDISKLNKQILDKDKIIQQMKQDHKMQLEGLQAKILQQQETISNKNQQIVELESIIEKLKEENTLLLSQPHPLNQPSKVLQCQVVKCLNDFDNLQTISPIKATVNKIKYEFEDSLQKTTNNQSQQELKSQKYQSQENFKRLFDIENRPQSQIKQRQNLDDTATHKTNLTTIKSRLTDLQKNKSALENRMKQFEERLKEKKSYQA